MDKIILIYTVIGMIYLLINIFRDLDEPDPLMTLAWFFFWPIFFILLIYTKLIKNYVGLKRQRKDSRAA